MKHTSWVKVIRMQLKQVGHLRKYVIFVIFGEILKIYIFVSARLQMRFLPIKSECHIQCLGIGYSFENANIGFEYTHVTLNYPEKSVIFDLIFIYFVTFTVFEN